MCQMSVAIEGDKGEIKMENVTFLEQNNDDVIVSTMFEAPQTIANAYVAKIDFLGGLVTLASRNGE